MRRRKDNPLMSIAARALMLLTAFLLSLSYASMVVNPAKAWYMTVLGLLFVPIVLINLLLLIWSVRRHSRAFMIPFLALLPSSVLIGKYLQFSSGATEPTEKTIKVMSYNVGRFKLGKTDDLKGNVGACMDSVVNFVLKTDADIVCLQEVSLSGDHDVANFIRKRFPEYNSGYFMYVTKDGTYGNLTLSKYPILDKGRLNFDKSSNLAIFTDVRISDESTLRVYNCHFESYNISLMNLAKNWRRESKRVQEAEERVKRSIRLRAEQVDQVMSDIEECPVEAIITGDFNDNPLSYTYHRLTRGREDTFVDGGKGFGATYSFLWPFIRIDYVLYPKHFSTVSHRTPRVRYSDHYPVVTEIDLSDR